jgi:hypothetical protein
MLLLKIRLHSITWHTAIPVLCGPWQRLPVDTDAKITKPNLSLTLVSDGQSEGSARLGLAAWLAALQSSPETLVG